MSARQFCPHRFKNRIKLLEQQPKVLISLPAYQKMWHYVDIADGEVGWFCSVSQLENNYLIENTYLPKQNVGMAHVDLDAENMTQFLQEILQLPNGLEIFNKIRFWGHSHAHMETSPSPTDENQALEMKTFGWPYLIRGILNKRGRIELTGFFFDRGIRINDMEWSLYDPVNDSELRRFLEAEFKQKVEKRGFLGHHQAGSQERASSSNPFNIPYVIGGKKKFRFERREKEDERK